MDSLLGDYNKVKPELQQVNAAAVSAATYLIDLHGDCRRSATAARLGTLFPGASGAHGGNGRPGAENPTPPVDLVHCRRASSMRATLSSAGSSAVFRWISGDCGGS